MIKRAAIMTLVVTVLVSGSVFAGNKEVTVNEDTQYEWSFNEEKDWLKDLDVSDTDMAKLEKLYNEAIKLMEAGKDDQAEKIWIQVDEIIENYYDGYEDFDFEDFTFEDEKEWLKELQVSDADMVKLEKLYDEAIKLMEADKDDEAEKLWTQVDDILENYYDDFEDFDLVEYTFEDEKEWLRELKVSEADIDALEVLFNKAIDLEKNGKSNEAEEKWIAFDKILDKYFTETE